MGGVVFFTHIFSLSSSFHSSTHKHTASRSLQYSNTSAPEPVQSSNTPTDTPSKTTAAEETAPIHLLLLSDDALPLSTGSFLHGETSGIPAAGLAGEQQRQPAKHSSEDAQGETLTKLLQVLQEGDVVKQVSLGSCQVEGVKALGIC